MRTWILVLAIGLVACEGPAGPQGSQGPAGEAGGIGETGVGLPGPQGNPGITPWVVGPGIDIAITSLVVTASAPTRVSCDARELGGTGRALAVAAAARVARPLAAQTLTGPGKPGQPT